MRIRTFTPPLLVAIAASAAAIAAAPLADAAPFVHLHGARERL